jgi:hypothetical protein
MSDPPPIRLIRAEMQRFTGREYQIAFDQFDAKSLQEMLRFLLDAEYEPSRSQLSVSPLPSAQPGVPQRTNQEKAA